MTNFVIDANAIHAFQEERIRGEPGLAHNAIEKIFSRHTIALDEEKLCLQEWIECAGGSFPFALQDWINDQLAMQRIVFAGLASNDCRRDLISVGLPQKDHKWVRLAIGCDGRRIVTGDIDFFEPRKKNASAKEKQKLRQSRKGACARMLRKSYAVEVMCFEHVEEEIADIG